MIKCLVYVVPFHLESDVGHRGATNDKISALRRAVVDVTVVSGNRNIQRFLPVLSAIWLEAYSFFLILFAASPEVVISRSYVGWGAILAGRLRGAISVREIHADSKEEAFQIGRKLGGLLRYMAGCYCNFLDRKADILIFNHPSLLANYEKKYPANTAAHIWTYNGVAREHIVLVEEVGSLPGGWILKRPYLLFVGQVSVWHGLEYALQMYVTSEALKGSYDFVIVGPISSLVDLEKFRIAGVHFIGEQSKRAVHRWIENAAACLLPVRDSRVSPGSPLKLYDYLAHGRPVITQVGVLGYADEVAHYRSGIAVDYLSPIDSGNEVATFLRGENAVDPKAVKEKLMKEGTWDAVMEKWLSGIEIYRQTRLA